MMNPETKIELTDRFTKELWPINRSGNAEMALSELFHAMSEGTLFEGGELTFDHIKLKYAEYFKYMKFQNNERDPRYHTKIDDIATFILKRRYNEDFKPNTNTNLDLYLYGD